MATKKRTEQEKEWSTQLERQFLAAYDENADPLFRHVYLRVRDRDQAKDVVQETFSRTWLYLSQGKSIAHIKAFLYRVANNLIVDQARRKKSASLDAMAENDGFEVADETITDPGDKPDARGALKLLSSLDEIYRTAVSMRYMEGMSPKEIAGALGVSENVVSVRIHRGVAQLAILMNRPKAAD